MVCASFKYTDTAWQRAEPQPPPSLTVASGDSAVVATDPRAAKANEIGAQIQKQSGPMVSFVMQFFGHAPELVRNLAHPSGAFLDEWKERLTNLGRGLWDAANREIARLNDEVAETKRVVDGTRQSLDSARDAFHAAEVEAAKAQGKAKEAAEAKVAERKEALQTARADLKQKSSERDAKVRAVTKGIREICKKHEQVAGSGALLGRMLEALNKLVMDRIMKALEPSVRHLISHGMRFVRGILSPIATAVIGALASVPFVGGALAPIGQVVYDMSLNALEEAGMRGLLGIVERMLAQLLRSALTPVFKVVQQKVLAGTFQEFTRVLGGSCGGAVAALKFSELPPKDRWLERALACSGRIVPMDWIHRDAAIARATMLRNATEMKANVAHLARSIADRYLARYGLTYDSWMAAVGAGASPVLVAQAARLSKDLERVGATLRAQLPRRR
jgi:hypothetical protein